MQVHISGQHMSIGEALTHHIEDKVKHVMNKYFENAVAASVHLSKQSYLYNCDIVANEGTGRHMVIKSSAECDDPYSSFDQSLTKLEKQLRRYKTKIKDHHKSKTSEVFVDAVKYTINPYETDESHPVTIAEKPVKISTLTVAEAIMKMDLENLPALLFKNASNNRINVVYYRKDGNISWVDTKE